MAELVTFSVCFHLLVCETGIPRLALMITIKMTGKLLPLSFT